MSERRPQLISSSVLHHTRKFDLVADQFELPTGETVEKVWVKHPGAVVVLPIDSSGSIIFIRQYRYPLRSEILELPAGTIEHNDPPQATAQRELQEEIGATAAHWHALGAIYSAPGFCSEKLVIFAATGLTMAQSAPELGELISLAPIKPDRVDALIASGELCDAKSICAIQLARVQKLI